MSNHVRSLETRTTSIWKSHINVDAIRRSKILALMVTCCRIGGSITSSNRRSSERVAGRMDRWGTNMERTACCHCGSLSLTATGEPTVVNCCHCKACQRRTGAVMHSGAYFLKSQIRVEGPEKLYTRDVEDGRTISFHFCPTCGSSVYWHLDLRPDHFGVAVGAFADPDFPPPTYSVWEESKCVWTTLPDGIGHYPQARK